VLVVGTLVSETRGCGASPPGAAIFMSVKLKILKKINNHWNSKLHWPRRIVLGWDSFRDLQQEVSIYEINYYSDDNFSFRGLEIKLAKRKNYVRIV
jgi:hypothetical protein